MDLGSLKRLNKAYINRLHIYTMAMELLEVYQEYDEDPNDMAEDDSSGMSCIKDFKGQKVRCNIDQ
jgi:hypothetical protein